MIIQAELRRKQSEYEGEACAVDKVIELPAQRFQQFSRALLMDYDFIAENKNAIRHDDDARHCLLILDTPHPEEDKRRGTIGHIRMDFGRSGNEFWHTWWPRGPEELNSPAFKAELQEVVDMMREDILKSRFSMERFCYEHGGKITGGYVQNYGYIVETEHYRYCLRCNPSPGDYNGYLTAYDLNVQRQNMAQDKPLVGRVTYANGDAQEFTDAEAFLKCVREELPYRPTTGFRYEVLSDDSAVRKAVDDIVFDLYGEENPRQQEDYEPQSGPNMTLGGM